MLAVVFCVALFFVTKIYNFLKVECFQKSCDWILAPAFHGSGKPGANLLAKPTQYITDRYPWNYRNIRGFLMFSEGIERKNWHEMS